MTTVVDGISPRNGAPSGVHGAAVPVASTDEVHLRVSFPAPLLVGELNPYGADPRYALYPDPPGCSGHRLCHLVLGMTEHDYLRTFDRVNLLQLRGGERWSAPRARAAAAALRVKHPSAPLILLGARVAAAFGFRFVPFGVDAHLRVATLPHPSGRCRLWNVHDAVDQARCAVALVAPQIRAMLGPHGPPEDARDRCPG